jgi:hypothetical protein
MVDTPTARFGARKQSLGSNVNTWGDTKLNEVLDLFDRGAKGFQSIAMTGDVTLNWTNYAAGNQGQVQTLKLTGALSGPANVIVPSKEWALTVINAAGATVTIKTSAGTGVAIPTGHQAAVYCDAADVFSAGATLLTGALQVNGKVVGVAAGTGASDAINKGQLDAAIAAATTSSSPGTVRISATDTTAKFLSLSVTTQVGSTVTTQFTALNGGGNEQLRIGSEVCAALSLIFTDTAVSTTAAAGSATRTTAACTITLGSLATGQIASIARDHVSGNTVVQRPTVSWTVDGVSQDFTMDENKQIILFICTGSTSLVSRKIGDLPT